MIKISMTPLTATENLVKVYSKEQKSEALKKYVLLFNTKVAPTNRTLINLLAILLLTKALWTKISDTKNKRNTNAPYYRN